MPGYPCCCGADCCSGTTPSLLLLTISGVTNGFNCSSCHQFNSSFGLEKIADNQNQCLWRIDFTSTLACDGIAWQFAIGKPGTSNLAALDLVRNLGTPQRPIPFRVTIFTKILPSAPIDCNFDDLVLNSNVNNGICNFSTATATINAS